MNTALLVAALSDTLVVGSGIAITLALLATVLLIRQSSSNRANARLVAERLAAEERFRALMHHSSDVITVIDEATTVSFMSSSSARVFGWDAQAMLGSRFVALLHPDDIKPALEILGEAHATPGRTLTAVWRLRGERGEWKFADTSITSLLHDPTIRGVVLNSRDVSERTALEAELTYRAFHDTLTRLPNRAKFRAQAERALQIASEAPERVAVLFIDLDDFKYVNDSYGHAEGDRLLAEVAARLLNATRGVDTVARMGGDEFAILVDRIGNDTDVSVIAERVIESLRAPFGLEAGDLIVTASIGVARGRQGDSVDDLMRDADVAMYQSKKQGKNQFALFRPAMQEAVRNRLDLETDLRHAIERDELALVFQPVVNFADEEMAGVEALVRWHHPVRGVIPPTEFIPLAEESGLIGPLGRWVLLEACRNGTRWRAVMKPGQKLWISVNISRRQLQSETLIDDVRDAVHETGFPMRDLVLEITESVLVRDAEFALEQLRRLRKLGLRLAIDDFGTGYSSLSALQNYPVDVLKIDRSFIEAAASNATGEALAGTIIALGRALNLETVAEGVEHRKQARIVCALGAQYAQGYFFSRPVRAAAIEAAITGGPVSLQAIEPLEVVRRRGASSGKPATAA